MAFRRMADFPPSSRHAAKAFIRRKADVALHRVEDKHRPSEIVDVAEVNLGGSEVKRVAELAS